MWWWRKIHWARIPPAVRVLFERYGETVVALLLANELAERPEGGTGIIKLWQKAVVDVDAAAAWLTERADLAERREDRLETVEWAVLIFVAVGVIVDIFLLRQHH